MVPALLVTADRDRVEVIRILLLRKPSLSRLFRNLRKERLRLLLFEGDIELRIWGQLRPFFEPKNILLPKIL